MKKSVWKPLVFVCTLAVGANAFTLTGKVNDEQGAAVSGASLFCWSKMAFPQRPMTRVNLNSLKTKCL